jgi:hypothetical protein
MKTESLKKRKTIDAEVVSLIAIVRECGTRKRSGCPYLREGVCQYDSCRWPSVKEIPEGASAPVRVEEPKPHWRVAPTPLFCAFCPMSLELQELEEDLGEIEAEIGL